MAAEQPCAMADSLNQWVGPLLQAERYEDVEGLTLLVILEKPYHIWAVAVAQKARVEALLAQGKFDKALAEAKSYYNETTLRETGRAADLVAEALRSSRDPVLAQEFIRLQQEQRNDQPGNNHVLKSIKVDGSIYEPALRKTRGGSAQYPCSNLIAQGNLLLLADRPAEARQSFINACQHAAGNQADLTLALEGIARAIRAEDGGAGRANGFVASLQSDPSSAKEWGVQLPAKLGADEVRAAAKQIALAEPPGGSFSPLRSNCAVCRGCHKGPTAEFCIQIPNAVERSVIAGSSGPAGGSEAERMVGSLAV